MIRVRVPKGLEVLLLIISGSEAEKGMLILTFLISIEKEFGHLSVNIPEDARNKIEAIHELRRLIDRYSGMGTGDDAAQLYREFMANKNLFLSFLGELSGNGEPLESAILERVAVGAATRDGFIKSHLKAAFKDNGFVNSFWWLRIFHLMHPKGVHNVLKLLKESGNSQAGTIVSEAKNAGKAQSSRGGKKRAESYEEAKDKFLKAWKSWEPKKGKKTQAAFLEEHGEDAFLPLKLGPEAMSRLIGRRRL